MMTVKETLIMPKWKAMKTNLCSLPAGLSEGRARHFGDSVLLWNNIMALGDVILQDLCFRWMLIVGGSMLPVSFKQWTETSIKSSEIQ